ncbi:MAG: TRZ/ATZ family protein [Clostridiales bacterium]|nr:TRZ/ATZ family protein [Clostridiales bacterium]
MKQYIIEEASLWLPKIRAGEEILLSGTVYTARDAAHKRIEELLNNKSPLPFPIKGSFIYYAGPTPPKNGLPIGSCGPTTSSRMDVYAPRLYRLGLAGTIGKGERGQAVIDAIVETGACYLCAIGGAGALATQAIESCEVIAFEELGCESVKRLVFRDFPLFVGIDSKGNNIFGNRALYEKRQT